MQGDTGGHANGFASNRMSCREEGIVDSKNSLSIGQLAKIAGINVETVRYYERRGLIEQPPRPEQGYRHYPRQTLERILFIKRAQELGFALADVTQLLQLGEAHCPEVQALAEGKLAGVRARIADLRRLEKVLSNLVHLCQTNPGQSPCPIVESLQPRCLGAS